MRYLIYDHIKFRFNNPSIQYHISNKSFNGGDNYHGKIKHKIKKKSITYKVNVLTIRREIIK